MSRKGILITVGADIGSLGKDLGAATGQLRAWSSRMSSTGSQMISGFTIPLLLAGGAAIKFGGDIDAMERALKANMGSAEAAKNELEALRVAALQPGLGFEQAVQGSVRLQSMGIQAGVARDILLGLGKATELSAGGQEEFGRGMQQMVQIMAKGKLTMEDWRRVVDAMPAMNRVLQDLYGTTNIEAIRNKVGVGEFIRDITMALNKMEGTGGSVKNSLENMQTSFKLFLANSGLAIVDIFNLGEGFDHLATKSGEWAQKLRTLSPEQKTFAKSVGMTAAGIAALGPAMKILGSIGFAASTVGTIFSGVVTVIVSGAASIGIVVAGIGTAFGGLINKIDGTRAALERAKGSALDWKEMMWADFKKFLQFTTGMKGLLTDEILFPTINKPKQLGTTNRGGAFNSALVKTKTPEQIQAEQWQAFMDKMQNAAGGGETKKSLLEKFREELQGLHVLAQATGKDIGSDLKSAVEKYTEEAGKAGLYTGTLKEELQALDAIVKSRALNEDVLPVLGTTTKLNEGLAILKNLNKELGDIAFNAKLTGDSSGMHDDQKASVISAINQMRDAGISETDPMMQGLLAQLKTYQTIIPQIQAGTESLTQSAFTLAAAWNTIWDSQKLDMISGAIDGLAGSFTAMVEGASGAAASFVNSVLSMAKALVKLIMMQYISSVMADKTTPNPIAKIAMAAIGGAVVLGILGSMGKKSESVALADGAMLHGPTTALMGEYIGANNNPEVVAPLDKLEGMIYRNMPQRMPSAVDVSLRLDDLHIANLKGKMRADRIGAPT